MAGEAIVNGCLAPATNQETYHVDALGDVSFYFP